MTMEAQRTRPTGVIDNTTRKVIRDIRQLRPGETIQVWTVQHVDVVAQILKGEFRASWVRVPEERLTATEWMAEEMRDAGLVLDAADAPIWVLLAKPEPKNNSVWKNSGQQVEEKLLELRLPVERLLISFHYPWSTACLDNRQVRSSDSERAASEKLGSPVASSVDVQKSWKKVFDLSLAERSDTSFWNALSSSYPLSLSALFRLQGTTTFLRKEDVTTVHSDW